MSSSKTRRLRRLAGAVLISSAAFAVSLPASAEATCSATRVAKVWKDGGCNDDYLGFFGNDGEPSLTTFNFNNKISSAEAGSSGCQSMRLYVDSNYGGASQLLHAGAVITLLAPQFNNEISSVKTTRTAAC